MPSRELTEILALVPPDFADPDADFLAVRATMAPFHGHPVPAPVTVTEVELGGVRCAWYEDTRQPRRERVVFHCHGGGLVSSPLDDYHFYGAMLAEQLEARVVMADYRLAPEHPFPAAHRDCSDRLPRAPGGRRHRPRPRGGQRGLVRRPAGVGRAPRRAGRGAGAARLLPVHLGLVRRLGAAPRRGWRTTPRSLPHRGVGPEPGPGLRRGPGGARTTRGSRRSTPT